MNRLDEGPLKQEVVEEMELRRKMKNVIVPTKDAEVRAMLRKMEEPITLFGEREVRYGSNFHERSLPTVAFLMHVNALLMLILADGTS